MDIPMIRSILEEDDGSEEEIPLGIVEHDQFVKIIEFIQY
jgi:hypothetical protein